MGITGMLPPSSPHARSLEEQRRAIEAMAAAIRGGVAPQQAAPPAPPPALAATQVSNAGMTPAAPAGPSPEDAAMSRLSMELSGILQNLERHKQEQAAAFSGPSSPDAIVEDEMARSRGLDPLMYAPAGVRDRLNKTNQRIAEREASIAASQQRASDFDAKMNSPYHRDSPRLVSPERQSLMDAMINAPRPENTDPQPTVEFNPRQEELIARNKHQAANNAVTIGDATTEQKDRTQLPEDVRAFLGPVDSHTSPEMRDRRDQRMDTMRDRTAQRKERKAADKERMASVGQGGGGSWQDIVRVIGSNGGSEKMMVDVLGLFATSEVAANHNETTVSEAALDRAAGVAEGKRERKAARKAAERKEKLEATATKALKELEALRQAGDTERGAADNTSRETIAGLEKEDREAERGVAAGVLDDQKADKLKERQAAFLAAMGDDPNTDWRNPTDMAVMAERLKHGLKEDELPAEFVKFRAAHPRSNFFARNRWWTGPAGAAGTIYDQMNQHYNETWD